MWQITMKINGNYLIAKLFLPCMKSSKGTAAI
jgi:hypothetical protein